MAENGSVYRNLFHLWPVCLFVCLFVFLALQPFWLYFHSPVAGFSLLVFEVSWSYITTHHSR